GPPEYSRLAALARGLIDGNPRTIAAGKPLYVIADGDIAYSLGNLLRETLDGIDLFVIDAVSLRGLDSVVLGPIRMPSRTVPVTETQWRSAEPRRRKANPTHPDGAHTEMETYTVAIATSPQASINSPIMHTPKASTNITTMTTVTGAITGITTLWIARMT